MGRLGLQGIEPSLSRRELQGLCKQHDLPVNGSNQDLAKSLASLSTQTNSSSSPEDHFHVPSSSEVKSKDNPKNKAKSSGKSVIDFRRKYVARKNSSVAGAYKRIACLKENRTKRKREWQASNQLIESVANAQSAEVSSTSNNRNIQVSPEFPETCDPNFSGKRPELKQGSQSTSPSVPCPAENTGQCSTGRISSNVDAFQFFVASEDGINLLIDLDSTPSDWIKSLKNEIYVPQTHLHENRHLGGANNQLNRSSINLKVSDGSSGCGNSPMSSLLPEFRHPIDDDTPKSSVPYFQLNDMNQLASFSCDAAPNLAEHNTQYCQRDAETHNSGNSSCLEKLNSINSQGYVDKEKCGQFGLSDHQILEADVGEGSLCHVSEGTSDKSSFCLSNERSDVARSFEDCNQENPTEMSRNKVMKPLDAEYHISDDVHITSKNHISDDTSPADVQQNLACSANNTEPDLTNRILDQQSSYHETQVKLNQERSEKSKTDKGMCNPEIRGIVRRGRPRKNAENADLTVMKFRSPKRDGKGSSSSLLVSRRRSKRLKSKEA